MEQSPFSKSTQAKMAACEAFGLHYWADHPAPRRMWAVDDYQRAHIIRWYPKKGLAVLQQAGEPRERVDHDFRKYTEYPTYDRGTPRVVAV